MTYEEALQIAAEVHAGQVDKAGGPYIDFLKHVAQVLREQGEDDSVLALAVLQDTITASTGKTKEDLAKMNIPSEIIEKIVLLTYFKNQSYIDNYSCELMAKGVPAEEATYEAREKEFVEFMRSLKVDPVAVRVKKALLSLLLEDKYIRRDERRELKTKFRIKKYKAAIEELSK